MGYAKLYNITDSSIMQESETTRLMFLTMLSMADFNGFFKGTEEGLKHKMRIDSKKQFDLSMIVLQSPDPNSTNKHEDGKRIIYQGDNRWWIVNYVDYRTKVDEGYKQFQNRKRQAKKRCLDAGEEWNEGVWSRKDALDKGFLRDERDKTLQMSRHTDTNTDTFSTESVLEVNTVKKRWKPPTEKECAEWLTGKLVPEHAVREGQEFFMFYESKNWMVGRTKMSKWQVALGRWMRRAVETDHRARYTSEYKRKIIEKRLHKRKQLEEENG